LTSNTARLEGHFLSAPLKSLGNGIHNEILLKLWIGIKTAGSSQLPVSCIPLLSDADPDARSMCCNAQRFYA
jgi:hypothetical protein